MEQTVIEYIRKADALQINDLLLEIRQRYQNLYPDFDVYLFTLPKTDENERKRQLEEILAVIR